MRVRTIIVAGQTMPGHSGQAVMISGLLRCNLPGYRIVHVPMNFSTSMADMNQAGVKKIAVLAKLIVGLWAARIRTGAEILYYPPAGPDIRPVMRDIVALLATRWCFRHTSFHFHAGGGACYAMKLGGIAGWFSRIAYGRPALSVRTSASAPRDDLACDAVADVVVENFAEDMTGFGLTRSTKPRLNLIFIGALIEGKGVGVLVEAMNLLRERGVEADLIILGEFASRNYRDEIMRRIDASGLNDRIRFAGVLHGAAKAQVLIDADVMVFPTFYHAETFGIVLAEAMSASLPIVTTNWRGIPSTVTAGEEGLIVPVRDPDAVAEAIASLAADPELRAAMGRRGRQTYSRRFTADRFAKEMKAAFDHIPQ